MVKAKCGGSINLMVAREKIRLAKASGVMEELRAAEASLKQAQQAHRQQTGCEEEH